MSTQISEEKYQVLNRCLVEALDQMMVRVGFSAEEVAKLCTRKHVVNLFKLVRGYSVLTVLKPFVDTDLTQGRSEASHLLTSEQSHILDHWLKRLAFSSDDIDGLCNGVMFTEMLHYIRQQAVLTRLVHVIDCVGVNKHSDFMGCRGVRHNNTMELLVWDASPKLGRFKVSVRHKKVIRFYDLTERVKSYLEANLELVPERWKRYDEVVFEATEYYDRGFMMGRATYSRPFMSWDRKRSVWK